jgi:hypothetical protein
MTNLDVRIRLSDVCGRSGFVDTFRTVDMMTRMVKCNPTPAPAPVFDDAF